MRVIALYGCNWYIKLQEVDKMNALDWESKFNAIVRDTVHNLDKVKVCVSAGLC